MNVLGVGEVDGVKKVRLVGACGVREEGKSKRIEGERETELNEQN